MAEKDPKVPFNIFRTVSILTLVLVLMLFVLGLFNQHEIMFSLFGYRHKEVPMYFVVLWSFFAGVVFMGVIWILHLIKNAIVVRALKKTIVELREKLNPTEP